MSDSDDFIQNLRSRWSAIDTLGIDFTNSPFGLTEEGLKDFRGFVLKGEKGSVHTIRKQRFENCDLTYAQFIDCEIVDSLFVGTTLIEVNFHSCRIASSPTPNCKIARNIPYQAPSSNTFEQDVRQLSRIARNYLLKPSKLELLSEADFKKAAIYCMSLKSVPSRIAFSILSEQFNLFDDDVFLIVLNQDDLSAFVSAETELVTRLFDVYPQGLGEVAWALNQKIVASDALAKLPIRETSIQRLQILTSSAPTKSQECPEDSFWQIIDKCRPNAPRFSPEAHTARTQEVLTKLTDEELIAFSTIKQNLFDQAYTWELMDAARTIGSQETSDDDFFDFRVNLIFQGREQFYNALRDPDTQLLCLEDARLLLKEKLDFVCPDTAERISDSLDSNYNPRNLHPGGREIADEPEYYRATFPNLYTRYWNHNLDRIKDELREPSGLIESINNHNHDLVRLFARERSNLLWLRGTSGRLPLDIAIASGDYTTQLILLRANASSDINKIDLSNLLISVLHEISNGYYCAAWLNDIEFHVWDVIMHRGTLPGDPECVYWDPNDGLANDLIWLSEQVQRWPLYRNSEVTTISLDEWKPVFETWKRRQESNSY